MPTPSRGRRAALLLHPVRMRIARSLTGGRELSTPQLTAAMADVPRSTLYHHIGVLLRSGVVEVTAEDPARGTPARTYALTTDGDGLLAGASADGDDDGFAEAFLAAALDRVDDGAGAADVADARARNRQVALELDDRELEQLLARLSAAVAPAADNAPRPGRRRWVLTTTAVPTDPASAPGGGSPRSGD
ncbi:helix-turn-helix domain-containing protein [Patulibacter sp. SYSU D01012]|uniref:helix-turn-helix domain-containing protein n=1 Tax=Patulibacter sp. SYSU D01012 TaxID=2817381 RepID=UPI001B310121|nr:helix-turn-helix domain-containing protein [Patulibacter sp. SYSU D01012]